MKGDFTRTTFDPNKHFLRVLMQQGRVQLDADWNEQASILLHYLQTLATDIIGPYAGPAGEHWGFEVKAGKGGDFIIGKGRYYVNGILCENEKVISYLSQKDLPLSKIDDVLTEGSYVVYLDVWERHICFVEDDNIREKALNGADTATRTKVVWQVRVMPLTLPYAYCQQGSSLLTNNLLRLSQVCMSARAKQSQPVTRPCLTEPEAQYRGVENQLYRVEIHNGNVDEDGEAITPTFKFSRENGSVIFPIKKVTPDAASNTTSVELEHLGCDDKLGLVFDDWVEYVDDKIDLLNTTAPLAKVLVVDAVNRTVTLSGLSGIDSDFLNRHPCLRRWDQKEVDSVNAQGVIDLTTSDWIGLEDGIEVKFSIEAAGRLRRGDYWLIPARHITGDIEWPKITASNGKLIPEALSPMGTLHTYAPLAIISENGEGSVTVSSDCRCSFRPLTYSCQYNYFGRLGIGTDLLCPQDDAD